MRVKGLLRQYLKMLAGHSKAVSEATGAWRPAVMLDMVASAALFGASPGNYAGFGFRGMSAAGRRTFLTHRQNQRLIRKLNGTDAVRAFDDKAQFSRIFERFCRREVLILADATESSVEALRERHEACVLKPRGGSQGGGVELLRAADAEGWADIRSRFRSGALRDFVFEEALVQHPRLSEPFGCGLAAVRVVTVVGRGEVDVVMSAVTVGVRSDVVNLHLEGLMAPVDLSTGTVTGPALSDLGELHEGHPMTGARFEGAALPEWAAVLELARAAARVVPEVGYVGWDIGITNEGPALIEGNTTPGTYAVVQHHVHSRETGGIRHRVAKYL